MDNIKNGKKPISQKTRPALVNHSDVFANPLDIDPQLKNLIADKGFSIRFINYKQFVDMGGTHEAYWRPVSRKELKEWGYDMMDTHSFISGSDPDGFIRRKDLILAVRTKELNEKHKAYLRQEAQSRSNLEKRHAEELRDQVRRSGLNATVSEGYEDEEENQ
jgi:hypothetical protein